MLMSLKKENNDFEDLTKDGFIKYEEEKFINVKFFKIEEDLNIKDITKSLKEENNILLIDLKPIIEDPGTIRILINKLKRISDDYSITMKLYGQNWLLILPKNVIFQVGDE